MRFASAKAGEANTQTLEVMRRNRRYAPTSWKMCNTNVMSAFVLWQRIEKLEN
jgi:hypothetical protein